MSVRPSPSSGRRWWVLLLGIPGIGLLIAALVAAGLTRAMWGYWIWRPAPDSRVLRASEVLSITYVDFAEDDAGRRYLEPSGAYTGPGWYRRDTREFPWQPDYYLLDERVLRALEVRGVLHGPVPSLPPERLADLLDLVRRSGRLARDSPGYDQLEPGRNGGVVYELLGPAGEPLLLIALRAGDISNDHLPYYEFLYEVSGGEPSRLVSTRRFFFDIAGWEWLGFVPIFAAFGALSLIATIPTTGGYLLYRRFSTAAAISRGHCPRCRYDLRSAFDAGCPECGWGRGPGGEQERDLSRYGASAWLTRRASSPPGWRTVSLVSAACFLMMLGVSTPGRLPGWFTLGALLALVTAPVVIAKVVRVLSDDENSRHSLRSAGFVAVAVVALITAGALAVDAPLRVRFAASAAAFDRLVEDRLANGFPGTGPARWVGLYRCHGAIRVGPGVAVLVEGANVHYANGFICFPDGMPERPTAWGRRLECEPLLGGWYLWRYADR